MCRLTAITASKGAPLEQQRNSRGHDSNKKPAVYAGAIGGFAGPYVVGALVDTNGGYVTCMRVLGGLFLVQTTMIICKPHHTALTKELPHNAPQGTYGSLRATTGHILQRCRWLQLQACNCRPHPKLMHCLVLHVLL